MKTLGIIGGLGPESTIDYYRSITALYRERTGGDGYPQLVIVSLDVDKGLRLLGANQVDEMAEYLAGAARQLAAAGANFALLSANSGHIVFEQLRRASPIPLISIVETTCEEVSRQQLRTVGLLGTRFTMAGRFYFDVAEKYGLRLSRLQRTNKPGFTTSTSTSCCAARFFPRPAKG